MSFPGKMSLQALVLGIPKTQGGLNGDEASSQWVVTILNEGQVLSLAKPEERLGAW